MTSQGLARFSQRMSAVTLLLIIAMLLLNAALWLFPQLSAESGYGFGFGLSNSLSSHLAAGAVFPGGKPWAAFCCRASPCWRWPLA